ncbi:MAG: substrate-binding domain-containing protein [Pseudomonadota bacterium]
MSSDLPINGAETNRQARQARLEDIAREAGVSISTVSRALNGSTKISAKTRTRIQEIADASNYGIRRHGRAYSSPSLHTIALVLPRPHGQDSRISEAFFLDLIGGIGDALREQRCDLLISHLSPANHDNLASLFARLNADGVIFIGQGDFHEELNALSRSHVPFVVWGAQLQPQTYPVVGGDNYDGGFRLASHLIRLGRRKLVFLGDVIAPEVMLRYQGFQDAVAQRGLDVKAPIACEFHSDDAHGQVMALIDDGVEFDAIVAGNDIAAIGAMQAVKSAGMRVPEDISVVGYDDVRLAAYASPPLTTIRQDVGKAGDLLVGKLLRQLKGRKVQSTIMPAELIIRDSCGASAGYPQKPSFAS